MPTDDTKVSAFFRHPYYKWWLLFFSILLCIAYQADNIPRTDDEYLGEQVYWLLKDGKVRSDLGYSDLGYHVYQSFFHKLFIYSGYVFSKIWGWSLYSLHAVSYVCFGIFMVLFSRYSRYKKSSSFSYLFFAVLVLMLLNQDILYAIGDFRPEVMIMTLGFAAYFLLEKYLDQNKTGYLIVSGICAGLCMFAHLNGIIFIAAGCLVLLFRRQFKASVFYGVIAVLAFLPYFADVLYNADLAYFWSQVTHDPILNGPAAHWYSPLLQIANEQSRFLFTEKQIIFTAGLILALLFSYKKIKAEHPLLLLYTLILIVVLAVICPSKSTKYMVLYLPFLYIILVEGWINIEASGIKKKILPVRTLLLAGIAISLFYAAKQIAENVSNLRSGGLIAEHQLLVSKIAGNHGRMVILAPRVMVFNQLGKFERLEDIGMVAAENFKGYVSGSDIDYVIFARKDRDYLKLDQLLQEPGNPLLIKDSTEHYVLAQVTR